MKASSYRANACNYTNILPYFGLEHFTSHRRLVGTASTVTDHIVAYHKACHVCVDTIAANISDHTPIFASLLPAIKEKKTLRRDTMYTIIPIPLLSCKILDGSLRWSYA